MLHYLWFKDSKYSMGSAPFYSSGVSPDNKSINAAFALVMWCQLAGCLSSMLKFFKEHVLDRNVEGLVPKLRHNAHLSSECVDLVNKDVLEQEHFLQFHEKLVASIEVVNGEHQCLRVP